MPSKRITSILSAHHSKHVKSGNYRPASETPSGWRFAGGPIVVRDGMLATIPLPVTRQLSFIRLGAEEFCMEIICRARVNIRYKFCT